MIHACAGHVLDGLQLHIKEVPYAAVLILLVGGPVKLQVIAVQAGVVGLAGKFLALRTTDAVGGCQYSYQPFRSWSTYFTSRISPGERPSKDRGRAGGT